MRARIGAAWTAVRAYGRFAVVLLIAGAVSAPWWWSWDATLSGIASNVFATILVTPVLIFGVEQALKQVAARRNEPRDRAIRSEVELRVARMLNFSAGTAKVPGLDDAIAAHIKAEGTRGVADRLTPVTAGFLRAHEVEARAHFAKIGWSVSGEILERISKELARTEVVLPLAGDAVSPEAFALLLRALQEINWASELHGIGELDRKAQAPGVGWEEGPGKNFASLVGEELGDVVMTLAEVHPHVFG